MNFIDSNIILMDSLHSNPKKNLIKAKVEDLMLKVLIQGHV